MSLFKIINLTIPKVLPIKNQLICKQDLRLTNSVFGYSIASERHYKSWGRLLRCMKLRRRLAGPERMRKRSDWDNWNYKSELYGFSKRLQENISEDTLRWAFIHESYLQKEEEARKELDITVHDVQLDLKSNSSLISLGNNITSSYLYRYLTYSFPKLPKEGITALHDHLMSIKMLSYISFNIGTKDLILSAEYPPEDTTLADSFKAVVGSIATDNGVERAENFILDFVCPQLVGQDVFEIWDLEEPLKVLNEILKNDGLPESEPRLIFESGRNTIESVYHVGLYNNKEFLGRGVGETLPFATEMAAYDVLRKIYGIEENKKPLLFGEKARNLGLALEVKNKPVAQVSSA